MTKLFHVITEDLNIIDNENFCKILANDPKYRKPQFINWKYNFKLLMDSDTLSERVKTVR